MFEEALESYTLALEIIPKYPLAVNNRGVAHFEKGNLDDAIEDYTKAIELRPRYAKAYLNRAIAYEKRGDSDLAMEDCNHAIHYNPLYSDAFVRRSMLRSSANEWNEAISDLTKCLEVFPGDVTKDRLAEIRCRRANAYFMNGDYDMSLSDCNICLSLKPLNADYFCTRGEVRSRMAKYESAIRDFDEALMLMPNDPRALSGRANALLCLDKKNDAVEALSRVVDVDPVNADQYLARAKVQFSLSKYEKCIEDCSEAVQLSNNPNVHALWARAAERMGRMEEAMREMGIAVSSDVKNAEFCREAGELFLRANDTKKSLQFFNSLVKYHPEDPSGLLGKGHVLRNTGKRKEAVKYYRKAMALDSESVDAVNGLALSLVQLGKTQQAIDLLLPVVDAEEKDILDSLCTLAHAYYESGQLEEALNTYGTLLEQSPKDVDALNNRGVIHHLMGRYESAVKEFSEALMLCPRDPDIHFNRANSYFKWGKYQLAVRDYDKLDESHEEAESCKQICYLHMRASK